MGTRGGIRSHSGSGPRQDAAGSLRIPRRRRKGDHRFRGFGARSPGRRGDPGPTPPRNLDSFDSGSPTFLACRAGLHRRSGRGFPGSGDAQAAPAAPILAASVSSTTRTEAGMELEQPLGRSAPAREVRKPSLSRRPSRAARPARGSARRSVSHCRGLEARPGDCGDRPLAAQAHRRRPGTRRRRSGLTPSLPGPLEPRRVPGVRHARPALRRS
jgi:hypothetical protein